MYSFAMLMVHEGKKGNASHLIAKKTLFVWFFSYANIDVVHSQILLLRNANAFIWLPKQVPIIKSDCTKNITFPIAQPFMFALLQTCLSCSCWVVVKELVCNYKGVNFSIACTFSFTRLA